MKNSIKKLEWQTAYQLSELLSEDSALLQLAGKSLEQAYAPYSKFKVGAAVLLSDGQMLGGSNQENAAYPLCLCAERVALSAAASLAPKELIKSMAITVKAHKQTVSQPAMPCGSCRQSLCEIEFKQQQPIRLIIRGEEGPIYIFQSALDILPFSFNASFL